LGACERWVVDMSWVRLCWCLDVVSGWKVRGCRWGVESSWWDSPYTEVGKKTLPNGEEKTFDTLQNKAYTHQTLQVLCILMVPTGLFRSTFGAVRRLFLMHGHHFDLIIVRYRRPCGSK